MFVERRNDTPSLVNVPLPKLVVAPLLTAVVLLTPLGKTEQLIVLGETELPPVTLTEKSKVPPCGQVKLRQLTVGPLAVVNDIETVDDDVEGTSAPPR